MTELERALVSLGAELAYPEAPDVSPLHPRNPRNPRIKQPLRAGVDVHVALG